MLKYKCDKRPANLCIENHTTLLREMKEGNEANCHVHESKGQYCINSPQINL